MYNTTHIFPYIYIKIHYQYHIAMHMQYSRHKQNKPNIENTSIHDHTYNLKTQQQKIINK